MTTKKLLRVWVPVDAERNIYPSYWAETKQGCQIYCRQALYYRDGITPVLFTAPIPKKRRKR